MHFDDINEYDPLLTQKKDGKRRIRILMKFDMYLMLVLIALCTATAAATFNLIIHYSMNLLFN